MRGELPECRQREVESSFPRATERLRRAYPSWAAPFLGSEARTKSALRELWDGWHLLCEANLALIESEACWVWYSEFRNPPSETLAKYFCLYFLEDTALRLGASCGHMLLAIRKHMDFRLAKGGGRGSTLVRTAAALEALPNKARALPWLRNLNSNKAWQACSEYRRLWTHNSRPAIAGLGCIMTSKRLEVTSDSLWFGFGTEQPVDWTIEELRPIFKKGYSALLPVYLSVIKLMSPDRRSLRTVEPMLGPRKSCVSSL
jgi:hypothetical protein